MAVRLRLRLIIAVVAIPVFFALASAGGAGTRADTVLIGTVGTATAPDAFHISLIDASGNAVNSLPAAGDVQIQVTDYSTIHNFHFFGPGGVSQSTDIEGTGSVTWTVTLVNGTYTYQCDAHATSMHGTLRVGPPPPPPPKATKLSATVKPGGAVALRKGAALTKSLPAGRYVITVADTSKSENFHITGPGVNATTTLAFKGTKRLPVTFKKGTYRYRSDAHPKLGRVVKVLASTGG
jgi:plastocyanin